VFAVRVGSILSIKVIQTARQICMWFGWLLKSYPNQTDVVMVGSVCAVYHI
jgi:hypothetical protein